MLECEIVALVRQFDRPRFAGLAKPQGPAAAAQGRDKLGHYPILPPVFEDGLKRKLDENWSTPCIFG
jgi:hypothetical protein